MGGWEEERWYALFQSAKLDERLGEPAGAVQHAYLSAFAAHPSRAEPLVELARFHRLRGEWALAHLFAQRAAAMPRPAAGLFIDEACYAWRALDELANAAWYAGSRDEGRRAAERLLAECRFPPSERARMEANLATYGAQRS